MANYLTKEQTQAIVAEYGGDAANTGSTAAQVALITHKIKGLSEHLNRNAKDFSCKRTLLTLVSQRKKLLKYVAAKDIVKYRQLLEKLNLRK